MELKEKALAAVSALAARYPAAECSLSYGGEPFRLFVMAVLSAQCTDERVNAVSVPLFAAFPTAAAMAAAPEGALEAIIRPVGLYKTKAKNLRAACARLVEVYGGEIPREMADLLSLAGVGRKVANLLRGDLYGLGGIVADTHCIRISNRLGLADTQNPHGVEKALDVLVPKEEQSDFCHRLVLFGREICSARRPLCGECPMAGFCSQRQGDR